MTEIICDSVDSDIWDVVSSIEASLRSSQTNNEVTKSQPEPQFSNSLKLSQNSEIHSQSLIHQQKTFEANEQDKNSAQNIKKQKFNNFKEKAFTNSASEILKNLNFVSPIIAKFQLVADKPTPKFALKIDQIPDIYQHYLFLHCNQCREDLHQISTNKCKKFGKDDFEGRCQPLSLYSNIVFEIKNFARSKNFKLNLIGLPSYILKVFDEKICKEKSQSNFGIVDMKKNALKNYETSISSQQMFRKSLTKESKLNDWYSSHSQFDTPQKIGNVCDQLPKKIKNSLHDFQRRSIAFSVKRQGRVLIGDEMGLGKTIQALAIACYYRQEQPVLIICPSSLKQNWKDEIIKWIPEYIKPEDVNLVTNGRNRLGRNDSFTIISYELASRRSDEISNLLYNVVILDESHYLKGKSTKRSEKICPIARNARRRILLSATALPNRPIELQTQLQCLKPLISNTKVASDNLIKEQKCSKKHIDSNQFPNRTEYSIRYCNGHLDQQNNQDERGSSNLIELNIMLKKLVMIRRLKSDVLPCLPRKNRIVKYLDSERCMTSDLRKSQEKLQRSGTNLQNIARNISREGEMTFQQTLLSSPSKSYNTLSKSQQLLSNRYKGLSHQNRNDFMALYHQSGQAKVEAIIDFIKCLDMDKNDDSKLLIFAHHQNVLDAIEAQIKLKFNNNNNKNEISHESKTVNDGTQAKHEESDHSKKKLKLGNKRNLNNKNKNNCNSKAIYIRIDGKTNTTKRAEYVKYFQSNPKCQYALLSITASGLGITMTSANYVVFAELDFVPSRLLQCEDRVHRIGQRLPVYIYYILGRKTIDDLIQPIVMRKLKTVNSTLDGKQLISLSGKRLEDNQTILSSKSVIDHYIENNSQQEKTLLETKSIKTQSFNNVNKSLAANMFGCISPQLNKTNSDNTNDINLNRKRLNFD